MRFLIVGCGYTGLALGQRLVAEGHTVFGLRRQAHHVTELSTLGIQPITADLTRPADLKQLPNELHGVINVVSSGHGGVDSYRQVYWEGAQNLVRALAGRGVHRLVHCSSTGVYGQADGEIVTEDSVAEPTTETGRILLAAERAILDSNASSGIPSLVVRASGIYGPGRGHLFRQFVAGEARLQGDGARWLNMIHRDDLAAALRWVLEHGMPGSIYNASDDEPVRERDFFGWLAEELGRPLPPMAGELPSAGTRKRGDSNKRVSNRRLRATGWTPQYPTFREGYAAPLKPLKRALDPEAPAS